MKRKYRVTPRGKVVFSAVGIIILILSFMLIQSLQPDQNTPVDDVGNQAQVEDSQSNDDQMDMGSNDNADESVEMEDSEIENEDSESTADDLEETTADSETLNGSDLDTSEQVDNCKYPGSGDQEVEAESEAVGGESAEKLYNAKTAVYFEPDKYDLQDEYKLVLNIFASVAKEFPEEMIKVEGNINGYPKFNDSKFGEELSQIRASKVAQYLMNMGIPEEMILVQSNGSSKPLNKSDSAEELKLNRRTDVYFVEYFIEEETGKK